MSELDPVERALSELPDEPLNAEFADRVGRRAARVLEREGRALAPFDRWALERVFPVVLTLCALGYVAELVGFFAKVYGR